MPVLDIGSDTHLALSYEKGVTRLENVGEVLHDLKTRACELGIVSDNVEAYVINDLGRKHDVHIDFYSVPPGKTNGLERAKKEGHPEGTRYVFVGVSKRDEVIAQKEGWGFRYFDKVADDEGWELRDENADGEES
ncbi:MAG: hypothetical protein SXQ77_07975 [Halobacteria archaeon]|nr:hypothetical protein [Halobacteria archaeon]